MDNFFQDKEQFGDGYQIDDFDGFFDSALDLAEITLAKRRVKEFQGQVAGGEIRVVDLMILLDVDVYYGRSEGEENKVKGLLLKRLGEMGPYEFALNRGKLFNEAHKCCLDF